VSIYDLTINGGGAFVFVFNHYLYPEPQDQVREAEVLSLSHAISLISSTLSSKTHTIRRLKVIGSERESGKKNGFL